MALLAKGSWLLVRASRDSTAIDPPPAAESFELRQAALPFEALSHEPEVRQLARSIPQEMAVRIAGSGKSILTPSTTGDSSLPCDAVRDLKVGWVYHGTVGRLQEQIRVTAQLTSCPSGERLWGDSYSRPAPDLLGGQDEIVTAILATSQPHMLFDYSSGPWRPYFARRTLEDNAHGVELAREARERSPIEARLALVQLHLQAIFEGWDDPPAPRIHELVEIAEECLELAPRNRDAHLWAGYAYMVAGDRDRMIASFERSVALGVDDVAAANLALGLAVAGRADEAIATIDAAVHASPEDGLRWIWEKDRAFAHFAAARYREASAAAQSAIAFNGNDAWNNRAAALGVLAASLAHLERLDEARAAMDEAMRLRPGWKLSEVATVWAAADPEHRERLLEGLRRAGLGEHGLEER